MLSLPALLLAGTCALSTFTQCEGEWCGWETSYESGHSSVRSGDSFGDLSSVTWGPFQGYFLDGIELEWGAAGGGSSTLRSEYSFTGLAGHPKHWWTAVYSGPICPPSDPSYPNCRGGCAVPKPQYASDVITGDFIGNVGVVVGHTHVFGVMAPAEMPAQLSSQLAIGIRNPDRSITLHNILHTYPPIGFDEPVVAELAVVDSGDGTHAVEASVTYGGLTRRTSGVIAGVDLSGPPRKAIYTTPPSACTSFGKYPWGAGRTLRQVSVEVCQ